MQFMGLFNTRNQRALQNLTDAPYHMLGRHALSAATWACDGGAMACCAGRLRNRNEVMARLLKAGEPIRHDAAVEEVVLAAYRTWGASYYEKLEGVIATVIVDQSLDLLIISRDRMGELPVFYAVNGGTAAFSDHPSVLIESSVASRQVDGDGINELFGVGPARTPGRTPFRDVRALEPGCALVADTRHLTINRYFSLTAEPHQEDTANTAQTVRMMLERAMRDVMMLKPGSMLSGGLDSTLLTAMASAYGTANTYSVDYEDNQAYFADNAYQPERDAPYIDMAVKQYKTKHTPVLLSIQSLSDSLHEAMLLRGFPGMADIDSSLMLFARAIAHSERFVLSGECGDEVFGGYPWFMRDELIHAEIFPWSGSVELRESILRPEVREKIRLKAFVRERYAQSIAQLPMLADESAEEARLRQVQGLCLQWFMSNLQERAQRMCAAAGLTVLTPYCDDRLVQYVYNVPWEIKRLEGQEKGLLRAAARDLLPEALLNRKKSPYPKTYHPEYTKSILQSMQALAADVRAPIWQVIDIDAIERLAQGPLSPTQTPWFGQLMTGPQMLAYLLQVNDWMVTYRVDIEL